MKLKKRLPGVSDMKRSGYQLNAQTRVHRQELVRRQQAPVERLVAVAIMRGDETHHGFKSHWELRASLGDEEPGKRSLGDIEGFWTDKDRFVSRGAAARLAAASGQASPYWADPGREFLSSDMNHW